MQLTDRSIEITATLQLCYHCTALHYTTLHYTEAGAIAAIALLIRQASLLPTLHP